MITTHKATLSDIEELYQFPELIILIQFIADSLGSPTKM